MLVEYIVLLQEAAILLVYLSQEIVKHQCSMRLLIGSVSPVKKKKGKDKYINTDVTEYFINLAPRSIKI